MLSKNLKKISLVGAAALMIASVGVGTSNFTVNARRRYRPRITRRYNRNANLINYYESRMPKLITKKLYKVVIDNGLDPDDEYPEYRLDFGRGILRPDTLPNPNVKHSNIVDFIGSTGYQDKPRIGYNNYLTGYRYIWTKPNYERGSHVVAGNRMVKRLANNYVPFQILGRIKHRGSYYYHIKHDRIVGWVNDINNRKTNTYGGIYGGFSPSTMTKFRDAAKAYDKFWSNYSNQATRMDKDMEKLIINTAYRIHLTHRVTNNDRRALSKASTLNQKASKVVSTLNSASFADDFVRPSIRFYNSEIKAAYKGRVTDGNSYKPATYSWAKKCLSIDVCV